MLVFKVNPNKDFSSEFNVSKFFNNNCFERENISFPRIDVYEKENKVTIQAEVAGIKKEDLKITVEKNHLVLTGNKNFNNTSDNIYRSENFYGSFKRSFKLSDDIDQDFISEKLEDGILTITFDKLNITKEKIIDIN